jgi:glycerophosphoryl diester phosphodiesterase
MKSLFRYCLFLTFLSPALLQAVEIIAHRGASNDAPENTLASAKLGWEQGADAVEIDLWLSADGKLVVFHDADTKRFAEPVRKIKSMTLAEIQELDVGAFKGAQFKGERVPSLESILATVPAGKRIVLELKDGPEILPEFVRVVKASALKSEQMCVISFKEDTLRDSKKALPDVPHYFLKGYKADAKTGEFPKVEPLLELCREAKFEGLNLHFDWPVTPEFTAKIKAQNLKLLIWTVDDPAVARNLAAAGVNAITTNRPAWLREQLKAEAQGGKP